MANFLEKSEVTIITWEDSFGVTPGWVDLEGYNPSSLVCISSGIKVFENEKVVALAPNYAQATTYTPNQANGLMVIPKCCIQEITSFSIPVSMLKLLRS